MFGQFDDLVKKFIRTFENVDKIHIMQMTTKIFEN